MSFPPLPTEFNPPWTRKKRNDNIAMRSKPEFFLLSQDDTIIHDPVKCTPIRFLRMGRRNDYLLCKVSPPIPGRCMGILKPGIETVVLVSRQSVGGLRRKLVGQHSVHVMRLLSKPGWLGLIHMKDIVPFSWSEVFPTKAEADHAKKMDAGLMFPSRYYFGIQKLALSVPVSWQFLAYGIKNNLMNLSEIPFYYMMLEKRNSTCPSDVEWKECHDMNGVQSKDKTIAFLELNEAREIQKKGREPESSILERWTFVIFDWAHGLDFPAWHRLALADEIAEEFGWPATLAGFSRKKGFPPEDEARRMAAWQTWLDEEREKWKPERPEPEVSK